MSIFKVIENAPFTMVSNSICNDKRISWKAKGILTYLLSKPNEWKVVLKDIENNASDGRESVSNGIKELIEAGYIRRSLERNYRGCLNGYLYEVYQHRKEGAFLSDTEEEVEPVDGNTVNRKPVNGKHVASNKELSNKELSNNKNLIGVPISQKVKQELVVQEPLAFYPIDPPKQRSEPVSYERLDAELNGKFTQESIRRYLRHKKEVKHKISQATLENHLKQCLRAFEWGCIQSPDAGLEIAIENVWQGCRAEWIKNYVEKAEESQVSYKQLSREEQAAVSEKQVNAFIAHREKLHKPLTLDALKSTIRYANIIVDKKIPQLPKVDNVLSFLITNGLLAPDPFSPRWNTMSNNQ